MTKTSTFCEIYYNRSNSVRTNCWRDVGKNSADSAGILRAANVCQHPRHSELMSVDYSNDVCNNTSWCPFWIRTQSISFICFWRFYVLHNLYSIIFAVLFVCVYAVFHGAIYDNKNNNNKNTFKMPRTKETPSATPGNPAVFKFLREFPGIFDFLLFKNFLKE